VEGTNKTVWVKPKVPDQYDMGKDPEFARNFDRYYTVRMSNYPVQELYLQRSLCMESEAQL
jgi:formylmethanofuran dehydrogenase subunit A